MRKCSSTEMKGRARTQTNWQIQDEQDQTANSEQVSHCGLEKKKKGQFILVGHWPFKLDLECCWWAEVYQCPCPVGYELIPCWYSWCCEQICELTPPRHTIRPSFIRSWATAIKAREVEQSTHSLQHQHNTVCPLKTSPCCFHWGFFNSSVIKS